MGSRHKLSEVLTKLSLMATCLQECISTMVELQSDSFNQEDAHLARRESSLGSLTSRNLGNNSNNKQEEERSSLGELTPRTCRSKSEEELEQDKLEQEEAEQQEQKEAAEARQLSAQQQEEAEAQQLTAHKRVQNNNNNNNKSLKKRSKRSFQNTRDGATYAGRRDTQPKLAGTTTSSQTSSTNKLG